MVEHPILVPTSVGTLGGMVAEPDGAPIAAAILLPGEGGPGRAGIGAFWARLSRRLAGTGLVTLRFDYPYRGNGASPVAEGVDARGRAEGVEDVDLDALREMAAWLRDRFGGLDLYLVGECQGARMAFEWLRDTPDVAGVLSVAPYLRDRVVPLDVREAPGPCEGDGVGILDEDLLASLDGQLADGLLVWILIGEHEGSDPERLRLRLGGGDDRIEIETVPGRKLHPVASPSVQDEVAGRLMRRIGRAIDRVGSRPPAIR